jgi:hypothetical protein
MRIHGPTRIVLAVLAVAITIAVAGCGSSDETTGGGTTGTAAQSQQAPAGAQAHKCGGSGARVGEMRVTGVPCGLGNLLAAAWYKNGKCSSPADASRTSCRLGDFTCLGVRTDHGLAVDCAGRGRSISFVAKPR